MRYHKSRPVTRCTVSTISRTEIPLSVPRLVSTHTTPSSRRRGRDYTPKREIADVNVVTYRSPIGRRVVVTENRELLQAAQCSENRAGNEMRLASLTSLRKIALDTISSSHRNPLQCKITAHMYYE